MIKILLKASLCLLFLFVFTFSILQTKWAKNQIQKTLVSFGNKQGLDVSIQSIDGRMPFTWVVKEMKCTLPYLGPLFIQEAKVRLSLSSLWKGVIELGYFKIEQGVWQSLPFSMEARGKLSLFKKNIEVGNLKFEHPLLHLNLSALLHCDLSIEKLSMDFSCPDIQPYAPLVQTSLKGQFQGNAQIKKRTIHLNFNSPRMEWGNQPFADVRLMIDADLSPGVWKGNMDFSANHLEIPLTGKTQVLYDPLSYLLTLDSLAITAPGSQLCASLMFTPYLQFLRGSLFLQLKDLKVLRPFFPNSQLSGQIGAKMHFDQELKGESISMQIHGEKLHYRDVSVEQLHLEGQFFDLFSGNVEGNVTLEGENLFWDQMNLSSIELNAALKPQQPAPFSFSARGTWKDPLTIEGKGVFHQEDKNRLFQLKQFEGQAMNEAFCLQEQCAIQWSPEHFKLNNFSLKLAQGTVQALVDLNKSSSFMKIKGAHFPLDLLALSQKDLSLRGNTTFDLDLIAWKENLQGTLNLALEEMILLSHGKETPLKTKGILQVHLNQEHAQIHGQLKCLENQFIDLSATLPIKSTHFPLNIQIDKQLPFSSEVTMEGKLQDLFDFVQIGAHRLEGWLSGHLLISKNLNNPTLQGTLDLHQGTYENYYTGTCLKNINAKIVARNHALEMISMEASDFEKGGTIQAKGKLFLNAQQKFPYEIEANLQDLTTISFDYLKGRFTGQLFIRGNRELARANGDLQVTSAKYRISDRLPTMILELPITFENAPEKDPLPNFSIFPLYLDLNLSAKDTITVEGKGLDSQWQGNLHVTGTHQDVHASGKLLLLKGEYLFAGTAFALTDGEIIFNDKSSPGSYISINGNCPLADVDIIASLHGPLSTPTLSLQSIPQMTISSILSRLLFNKDHEEISAIQALQLAQAILSLSKSEAPDILEKIRKSLGIDRLSIASNEKPDRDTFRETISLQIGKYLMRGVLLTLSQGSNNRNVSLEVQMRRGFMLQAQLGENERGKFSLKWHHHY